MDPRTGAGKMVHEPGASFSAASREGLKTKKQTDVVRQKDVGAEHPLARAGTIWATKRNDTELGYNRESMSPHQHEQLLNK